MTLVETLIAEPPPLRLNADGVLLVVGTRIPIETLINAYEQGDSPNQIVADYDSLHLDDVYGVLRYYLRHRQEVDRYLRERREKAEAAHRLMTPLLPSRDLRDRPRPHPATE